MILSLRILFLVCLLPFITLKAQSSVDAPEITLGFLLGGDPEAAAKQTVFFAEKIQQAMGTTVKVFVAKDYQGLIAAIKENKVNVGVFTALTYVLAERELPLKTLLKKTWEGPYYYSSLVTLKKSKIKNIKQLKGKKIGFVDKNSTSGYLYPQVFLRKNKLNEADFSKILFTGNHSASIKALENKDVDAVAVFSDDENGKIGAWTRFSTLPAKDFNVIWTSEPIPNDPIVVSQSFYDENTKFVHELMIEMIQIQNENTKNLSEILGKGRLLPATSKQYDPVREMVKIFEKEMKL